MQLHVGYLEERKLDVWLFLQVPMCQFLITYANNQCCQYTFTEIVGKNLYLSTPRFLRKRCKNSTKEAKKDLLVKTGKPHKKKKEKKLGNQ